MQIFFMLFADVHPIILEVGVISIVPLKTLKKIHFKKKKKSESFASELLSLEELVPMKSVHSLFCGFIRESGTLFGKRKCCWIF